MERITEKQLLAVVDLINIATKSPTESYSKDGASPMMQANIGNYHISFAYGGVALYRMTNTSGGVDDVFRAGHMPKRELYNRMQAFLDGLTAKGE